VPPDADFEKEPDLTSFEDDYSRKMYQLSLSMKIDYLVHRIAAKSMDKEFAGNFQKTQQRKADYKYTMRNIKKKRGVLATFSSDSEKYKDNSKTRLQRAYKKK